MNTVEFKAEQQRQTNLLTQEVSKLIADFGARQKVPMLGAVVSSLAFNLGQAIGTPTDQAARDSLADGAARLVDYGMDAAKENPMGSSKSVLVTEAH